LSYNFRCNQAPFETQIGEGASMDPTEVKFQISFKTKIWPALFSRKSDLWFGYTQVAYWQAYNWDVSAPFRETNYEPELIYSRRVDRRLGGLNIRLLTASFSHQSNGRSEPLSRSWNRLIGGILLDRGTDFALALRGWWRIPESGSQDDNPDIEDYVGRGELWLHYRHEQQTYSLMVRNNLRLDDNRSAVQLDWTRSIGSSPFQGYVQYFWGYGDGLIDYDHISHRLSVGVMLYSWL
jgi:phospholipase A1